MKFGWQRILSMAFLIAALVMFVAMHFLQLTRYGDNPGWGMWPSIGQVILDPRSLGEPRNAMALFSFLTFSLLVVASPFLGNVWGKSLLAWSITVIVSGVAVAGYWFVIFQVVSVGTLRSGGWCLIISPMVNFIGLLLARPQWLKRSGLSFPPESQAAV